MDNPEKEWFGEKHVSPEEKTQGVIGVFDSVADQYDVMNDAMSFGIHRLWKDHLIRLIRPRAQIADRPVDYLDVAGGTGDIAFRIRKKIGSGANITLCDLNDNMLSVGRDRAIDKGWVNDFSWVTGNAESLPIEDNSVDIYTIAFGLRNVPRTLQALKEAYRVLKPGGRFFCLEFSKVVIPGFDKMYDEYSFKLLPKIGEVVAKDRESYVYLVESIRRFPDQETLKELMREAGFDQVKHRNLSGGIAAIHSGWKL